MSSSIGHAGVEVFIGSFPSGRRASAPLSIDGVECGVLRRIRHGSWVAICSCGVELSDIDPVSPVMSFIDHRQAVTDEQ